MAMKSIPAQDLYDALRASAADLDAYGGTMGNDGIVALEGRFDLTAMAAYNPRVPPSIRPLLVAGSV